ncbi:MAG: hypothetical protein WBB19_20555 [Desulforhopalus sp.]
MDPYNEAHLFVAAIRILQYQRGGAPPVEDVCTMLDISVESGLAACRKLKKFGILDLLEDPFSIRLSVTHHLEIENLPRERKEEGGLNRDIEEFMAKKKNMDKKVEDIQAALNKKKQDLFRDVEEKMKRKMEEINKKE